MSVGEISAPSGNPFLREEAKMTNDFEDVLLLVGSYGKYQKSMVAFVLIPTSFFIAFSINTLIFQTVVPENYWCDPAGRNTTLYTQEEWWNATVPRSEDGNFEKCLQYQIETENGSVSINTEVTLECSTSWEHDRFSVQESMATSMLWLCDKEIYSTNILSANLAGNAVGTMLLPIIADKYTGRRIMFFIASAIHLIFNLLLLAAPFYGVSVAIRFIGGLSFQSNYQMPYVIGLELTCPDKRALVSFYSFVAWALGMCSTALVVWLIPHWWYLIIITCFISVLFFFYWRVLPESPRWLVSKGKFIDAADILVKIGKVNKSENADRKTIEKMLLPLAIQEETHHCKEFLKYKRVFLNCLLVICLSFSLFMGYGCTLFNVKILPNNIFLSFFVLSISELPSNILGYLSVHYLGRRFTGIVTSLLAMIFCFLATLFLNDRIVLLVIVSLIKIFVTQGIYLVYVVGSEVFPTPVRSTGMGIVTVSGMISLVFAPYVVAKGGAFQYWTMIGLCSAASVFSFLLPETLGLPLPQTFGEADMFWKKRPLLKWIHNWNKDEYKLDFSKDEKEDRTDKSGCRLVL